MNPDDLDGFDAKCPNNCWVDYHKSWCMHSYPLCTYQYYGYKRLFIHAGIHLPCLLFRQTLSCSSSGHQVASCCSSCNCHNKSLWLEYYECSVQCLKFEELGLQVTTWHINTVIWLCLDIYNMSGSSAGSDVSSFKIVSGHLDTLSVRSLMVHSAQYEQL